VCVVFIIGLTFTFTFGEDSMLSSAEAVISFGSMHSPEITKRLCKSLFGFCKPPKKYVDELVEVPIISRKCKPNNYGITSHHCGTASTKECMVELVKVL